MPDTSQPNPFVPASQVKERHAMVVALEAPPNAGKTYSGCRLAKGAAEAQGKRWCVIDTEGGRTLHVRKDFDFDHRFMEPPHRPEKYLQYAQDAQSWGYGAVLIDSFSNVWRGIGGVLHWADEELEAIVERQRKTAERFNKPFDEAYTRDKNKSNAFIRPKTAFKFMMAGLLDLRIPIILSIRGETTYDPGEKKEIFKVHMNKGIGFDVTCRFRLAAAKQGVIDITDSEKFKMEGDHAAIFRNGEQLSEKHGAALEAWARNGDFRLDAQSTGGSGAAQATTTDKPFKWTSSSGKVSGFDTAAQWSAAIAKAVGGWPEDALQPALDSNIAEIRSHMKEEAELEHASAILRSFSDRGVLPPPVRPAGTQEAML